ncbi:MAG TPA: VOC family protein [Spirochaetota bacterium]|nr:VOC family protein [Spirochaetota bacterium]
MIVIEALDHIGITVSSLDKSIEFYRDLFDFEIVEKFGDTRQAFLRVGDVMLGLYEVSGYRNQDGTKNHLSFYVDEEDFDDAMDEINDKGITVVFGPENIRKGKSVIFLDPDGNQIEICYPRMSA